MSEAHSTVLERIGRALHAHMDDAVREPVPERWVDLIHYLNEKEQAAREAAERRPEAGSAKESR